MCLDWESNMEDTKVIMLLERCNKAFQKLDETLIWVKSFLEGHPGMVEVPQELKDKIADAQLEVYDCKQLTNVMQLRLKSLGNNKENE